MVVLATLSGEWKEQDWKIWLKKSGEGTVFSECTQSMRIFASHLDDGEELVWKFFGLPKV